jgi:hypothetical protein
MNFSREVASWWHVIGRFYRNGRVTGKTGVLVIDSLMQCLQATGMVDDRARSGRPRKSTHREDRLIAWCAWRNRFNTSARILDELNFRDRVSVRTVNRSLNEQRLRARRRIKRPQLSLYHRLTQWNWSCYHLRWNIRNWKRVYWSDESVGIETLHAMTGTWWVQQCSVAAV